MYDLLPTHSGGGWQPLYPRWLLVDDICSLPYGPLHKAHNMAGGLPQKLSSKRKRESKRGQTRWKSQSLYNLISEVTSSHCCHILFLEESLGPAHTQGERITQGHEHREVGHWGPFRDCLLQEGGWAQHRERWRVSTRCVRRRQRALQNPS